MTTHVSKRRRITDYFSMPAKNSFEEAKKLAEKHNIVKEITAVKWTHVNKNNLNISYGLILSPERSAAMFAQLESELEYLTGDLARVRVFGKVVYITYLAR